ncbi:hypothetical protein IJ21_44750 [Paenibacillus sp. 32O-W]|nr:hypothetical protein IJ21_44750 [Paenibacillus sp. 32O-W]
MDHIVEASINHSFTENADGSEERTVNSGP